MNKLTAIFVASVSALIITGCEPPYIVDEILLQEDRVSLVQNGAIVFEYDGNTCQLSYNAKRNEYRAMDDDMANYFVFKTDSDLSDLGQEVTAELEYTTTDDVVVEQGLVFKVERLNQSTGMIWLWCNARKIGVVVRKI